MSEVIAEKTIKGSAEQAWAVVSDWRTYAQGGPGLRAVDALDGSTAGEGARRRCATTRGAHWTERCARLEPGRVCVMESESVSGGLPFARLTSTFTVEPLGDDVQVRAEFSYAPRPRWLGPLADSLFAQRPMQAFADGLVDAWAERIHELTLAYKATVATVLRRKGDSVVTVPPDLSIAEAAGVLAEHGIGCVIVARSPADVEGLVSERDIARAIARQGRDVLDAPVSDIMTRKLFVCSPDDDMFFAMACMTDRRIRHLPVMEDGVLAGIISIGDVVKERIGALESESDAMREYIAGREWRHSGDREAPGLGEAAGQSG